jgi:hypothetical protein
MLGRLANRPPTISTVTNISIGQTSLRYRDSSGIISLS